ncbi:MAG TPA: HEAT repeat domain-containing protein [Candidatus Sulfotelmatobacter sp.]|nr:HEAT repeat domain-containing protein [Candidatus Sulfotelmatobacter sp.]
MNTDPKATAARAFVRSLNILLKFARLYGHDHARVVEQLTVAWNELRAAIPEGAETGLLLGASGAQLLVDGVPLDGSPAEKQFAQLLSAAGLASVQFTQQVTEAELAKFVHAFPAGKAKPAELAEQLKTAIVDAHGIRVNEVCFVATDSRLKESSMAAQIAAASMGDQQDQFRKMLNDPKKLLELIAAAEGSKTGAEAGADGTGPAATEGWGGGISGAEGIALSGSEAAGAESGRDVGLGAGPGAGGASEAGIGLGTGIARGSGVGGSASRDKGGSGIGTGNPGIGSGPGWGAGLGGRMFGGPDDESIYRILRALATFGSIGTSTNPSAATVDFQDQVSQLPGKAQETLRNALAGLAEQGKNKKLDEGVLVQLAEHLSIRFALEQFERGEVKVNAVRQMLDRLNQEIERLRNILGQHEDKMAEAGILVESHREMLDRVFWASVPESAKREVLLSDEAWCIPPKNVQSYVAELVKQGEMADAISILRNYASCAASEEPDARKRAATGLSEMAGLYADADPRLLQEALRHIGLRLSVEQDQDVQSLVSAAFVRLSQEAATHRQFAAMSQALNTVEAVEGQRPGIGKTLRARMGIEERVPEFVEEALRVRGVASGLTGVLKHLPQTAMEQLSLRFNRCQFRNDLENVASLAQDLGEEALQYLRATVRGGPIADATEFVGLLARLDTSAAEDFLPARMKDFPRTSQDRVIRHVAASGAHGTCRLLLALLDHVDPLVMPLVIDEIGMTGDREALGRLLTIADGDLPTAAAPYLRLKALEALGRLRAPESIHTLRRIVDAKKMFGWVNPQELRIAAFQALAKMDPEWARKFLPESGIEAADLTLQPLEVPAESKFVRQRRHARIRLQKSVAAVSTNLKQNCRLEIKTASLAGGLATTNMHLAPGTKVQLRMQLGLRNVQATALMRDYRSQDMSFEIIDIGLDERGRLRKLLMENLGKETHQ